MLSSRAETWKESLDSSYLALNQQTELMQLGHDILDSACRCFNREVQVIRDHAKRYQDIHGDQYDKSDHKPGYYFPNIHFPYFEKHDNPDGLAGFTIEKAVTPLISEDGEAFRPDIMSGKILSREQFRLLLNREVVIHKKLDAILESTCLLQSAWELGGISKPDDGLKITVTSLGKRKYDDVLRSAAATGSAGLGVKSFSLPGQPELTRFFQEKVLDVLMNPEAYRPFGLDFPESILLYGEPGCGKSRSVEQLASSVELPHCRLNMAEIGSRYVHETANKIESFFSDAIKKAPAIVTIDELDGAASSGFREAKSCRIDELATLLKCLEKARENKVLVIGITNNMQAVDKAVLRPGRLTYHFEVEPLDKDNAEACLDSIFRHIPHDQDCDFGAIAAWLTNKGRVERQQKNGICTLADIYHFKTDVCTTAARNRMKSITNEFLQSFIDQRSVDPKSKNTPD